MRILVTGAEGQLARSLMEESRTFQMTLTAVGRPDLDFADLTSIAPVIAKANPDLVINAAAYTGVDKAEENVDATMRINAEAPGVVAEVCSQRNIPLVHISTDYVFDGTKTSPYVENDPIVPLGVYGKSKALGEASVAQANKRHIILRTAWVYSPFGNNFVKTMLRLAQDRDQISVVNDQRGSPTYAPHLAAAILAVVKRLSEDADEQQREPPWGIYHAAGAGSAAWSDVAAEVFKNAHKLGGATATVNPITTAEYPTPAKRPANSRLNCSKLYEKFAVALPDWRFGVAQCVARLLEN